MGNTWGNKDIIVNDADLLLLAGNSGQYRHRPERDITALKAENHRLRKCLEAGIRLNVALGAYLDSLTGKALSGVKQKRERFSRLLAGIQLAYMDVESESIVELQEPGKLQDVSSTGYSTSNQGMLF